MKKKNKEPKGFDVVNRAIALYGGRFANWKSSGFSGDVPEDLLSLMEEVNKQTEIYLRGFKNVTEI